MTKALEINGAIYCPDCVEEWRLNAPNPEATDYVIEVKPPFTRVVKCSFPTCNKKIEPFARKWKEAAY